MKAQLTLTIERNVIADAKAYAVASNQSLSSIIENYLRNISSNQFSEPTETYDKDVINSSNLVIPEWLSDVAGVVDSEIDPIKNKNKIRDLRAEKYLK